MSIHDNSVVIDDNDNVNEEENMDTSDWNVSTKKIRGGRKQKGVATVPTTTSVPSNSAFSTAGRKKTTGTSSSPAGAFAPKKKTGSNPSYDKKMNQQFGSTSSDKTLHPPHYDYERTVDIPAKIDPRFLVGERGSFSNDVKKQTGITWYSVKNMKVVIGGPSEESVMRAEELVLGRLKNFSMAHFSETFSTLVIPEIAAELEAEDVDINNVGTEYDIVLRPFTSLAVYSSQPSSSFQRMTLKKEGDAEEVTDASASSDVHNTVMADAHHEDAHANGEHHTHHKEMTLMNKKTKADMLEKIAHKLVDIETRKNDNEVLSVKALYGQLLAFKSAKDSMKIPELLEMRHGRDVKYHFNRIVEASFFEKLKKNLKYIPDEDATIVAIYFGKQLEKPQQGEDGQTTITEKNETVTFEVNKATGKLEQIKKNEHTRNYYTLNYVTPVTKERSHLNDFKITIASYVPNEEEEEKKTEMDSFLLECTKSWDNEKHQFTSDALKTPPSPYRFKGTIVKFKKHFHSEDSSIKVTLHEIHDLDTRAINYEVVVVSEELYKYLDDKELKDKKKKYKESLEQLTEWLFNNQ